MSQFISIDLYLSPSISIFVFRGDRVALGRVFAFFKAGAIIGREAAASFEAALRQQKSDGHAGETDPDDDQGQDKIHN
jgi:hypothetical protein